MDALKKLIKKILQNSPQPLRLRDIALASGMGRGGGESVRRAIDELVAEGVAIKADKNRYAASEGLGAVTGRLSVHRDGYGFVSPESGEEDIFIPARFLRESLHGDIVAVNVMRRGRYGKREGRVVKVLKRAHTKVTGKFDRNRKVGFVIPEEKKIRYEIIVPPAFWAGAEPGQMVVVEITEYPVGGRPPLGRIVEVLGWPDDPDVEVMTIVKKHGLAYHFPADVLAEADKVPPKVMARDIEGRVDLRRLRVVTIDGETARDFDDAVAVRPEEGGKVRLWVSIADVSHYVAPGSPLDREAYLRSTSVYFPDRAIPMLPEPLSTGICSLNPDAERLTVTAELLFSGDGRLIEENFYPSVIKSMARLTYTEVRKIVEGENAGEFLPHPQLHEDLHLMRGLALRLMERREKRGSIDFDLPEPEVVLDLQGQTEAIIKAERNIAHRIIEEFMLAANEAVACFLEKRGIPSLYRVHDPPELAKLRDFQGFIHHFGYKLAISEKGIRPIQLQRLMEEASGKPEERMIHEVLLRSMKQARYTAENAGHFGLAAHCYTHFTSPIRRYPDLIVHRILKRALSRSGNTGYDERLALQLPEIGDHCSTRERVAMDAERDIIDLKKLQFMEKRVGEEFHGFITGVTSFGFFVELVEYFVEGLVHLRTLADDYYIYLEKQHALMGERTKRLYRIGDKVRVRLEEVSVERREMNFILLEDVDSTWRQAASSRSGFHRHDRKRPASEKKKGRDSAARRD